MREFKPTPPSERDRRVERHERRAMALKTWTMFAIAGLLWTVIIVMAFVVAGLIFLGPEGIGHFIARIANGFNGGTC